MFVSNLVIKWSCKDYEIVMEKTLNFRVRKISSTCMYAVGLMYVGYDDNGTEVL